MYAKRVRAYAAMGYKTYDQLAVQLDPAPSDRGSLSAVAHESLQGCWVPADLQGFREIASGCERSNLLVLLPVWYPFFVLAPAIGGDSRRLCLRQATNIS
jgi:hypothetical protein